MRIKHSPLVLIVLDGWGYSEKKEGNAIANANTPTWDYFLKTCPNTLISGSGRCVGLPDGQMGNSEVGHMNMGAGRIVYQDLTRITAAIEDKSFFDNSVLCKAVDEAVTKNKAVHLMGLLSPGGVHSHEDHIIAMIQLAAKRGAKKIYVHAFLDGRDTPPKSALASIERIEKEFKSLGVGEIASIVGRYYAMDRDKRWERVEEAYDLLVSGKGFVAPSATAALQAAYDRGESDEFVKPTIIVPVGEQAKKFQDGDAVIFMNFRSDRAREITQALIDDAFAGFVRKDRVALGSYVALTEYHKDFKCPVAFGPQSLAHMFGDVLSENHLKQLRLAETEKYAHVTFFFNGGVEQPVLGEDRILIPSPKVATYDLKPEMSAKEITEQLTAAIASKKYDFILCNYANADMVGHTGNYEAAVKAIETIDHCLHHVLGVLKAEGGEMLITADHGNAEQMLDEHTHQAHTAHTSEPVPLVYFGRNAKFVVSDGKLSDLAPTMLSIMGLPIPKEMTGRVLIEWVV